MDRRYSANRFYNGTRASTSQGERGEALVRSYLAQARRAVSDAQSYGGSTGGQKSAGGSSGLSTLLNRNEILRDERETFRQQGSGALGARASIAESRGYR
jgi:hypothetical protein